MCRSKYRLVRLLAGVVAVTLPACNDATSPASSRPETPPPNVTLSPSHLVPLGINAQVAAPGAVLHGSFAVEATTFSGQPVPGVGVVFRVTEGGGSIDTNPVFTDAEGIARSGPWRLGTAGAQTMNAVAGHLMVTFTAFALAVDTMSTTSIDSSGPATGNVSGRLAFLRDGAILLFDIEGNTSTELLRLPPHASAATATALSPDRAQVAFLNPSSTDVCIASATITGGQCAGLQGYHDVSELAWSPDGRRLAFIGPVDVECTAMPFPCPADMRDAFVLDATTIARVTPAPAYASMDFVTGLAWSPDGQRLAVAEPGTGIYTINPDGSGRRLIYPRSDLFDVVGVRWSPDGQWLALTLRFTTCGAFCDIGIAIVRLDGTGFRLLARVPASAGKSIFASSWSPDGTALAYDVVDCSHVWDPCQQDVFVVGTAGGPSRALLSNAELLGWFR